MDKPIWNLHAYDTYEDYVKDLDKYCTALEATVKYLEKELECCWDKSKDTLDTYREEVRKVC